jgi:hypothetical protein
VTTRTEGTLAKAIGVAAALCAAGCFFSPGSVQRLPTSHVMPPNASTTPIREAKGSASSLCGILLWNWGHPNSTLQEEALKEALEASGGDLLVNVHVDQSVFLAGPLFMICNVSVKGTAVKLDAGKRGEGSAAPGKTAPPAQEDYLK